MANFNGSKTMQANSNGINALSVYDENVVSICGYVQNEDVPEGFPIDKRGTFTSIIATMGILKPLPNALNFEDLTGSEYILYPNPVNSILFIKGLAPNEKVSIFDLNRRLMVNKQLNGNQIDVNELVNGVYILKISNTNSSKIMKFIKQ